MITPPPGVQVYLACGYTDMRKGMATLAMLVQQTLGHDPFSGTVYAFRGRRGGDRPWAGSTHPAAAYVYSEDRRGEHPTEHLAAFRGTLQVDVAGARSRP